VESLPQRVRASEPDTSPRRQRVRRVARENSGQRRRAPESDAPNRTARRRGRDAVSHCARHHERHTGGRIHTSPSRNAVVRAGGTCQSKTLETPPPSSSEPTRNGPRPTRRHVPCPGGRERPDDSPASSRRSATEGPGCVGHRREQPSTLLQAGPAMSRPPVGQAVRPRGR